MSGEQIVGLIISLLCSWGCGALFFLLGLRAEKCRKPVNFWAGSEIAPCRVSDIAAYNHENAVMWKLYSVPYWVSGILFALDAVSLAFTIAGAVVLFSACFPGLLILIRKYRQIEKNYIV